MPNVFTSNPLYFDTDTTTAGNTNWQGSSGGKLLSSNVKGIVPTAILVQQANSGTALVAGNISVADPASSVVLFKFVVNETTMTPVFMQIFPAQALWRDFILTGLTATNAAMQVFYKGW
jgi:hypothetical protein